MHRVVFTILLLATWLPLGRLTAAEKPSVLPLRTNDVIAFIGGANMVALAQSGHPETLLTLRHPHHKLRFRSLAWEGDTVFAQPRDVNYPDLVTQLKQVGATVAFVQFGQMESLAGEAGLTNFVTAYEVLLDRLSATCPRILLLRPTVEIPALGDQTRSELAPREQEILRYSGEIRKLALSRKGTVSMFYEAMIAEYIISLRDHVPESEMGTDRHRLEMESLMVAAFAQPPPNEPTTQSDMRSAIVEKNRLWNDYARPSNWAFLAGDRTEQAFSRDYRDRNIRAFAQEMQQFLPLITDAEKRIDELAAKAAAEKESTR